MPIDGEIVLGEKIHGGNISYRKIWSSMFVHMKSKSRIIRVDVMIIIMQSDGAVTTGSLIIRAFLFARRIACAFLLVLNDCDFS